MINEKYSYKDFTNINLSLHNPEDFSNTTIIGSCFYIESNDFVITFPSGTENITFNRCNLDNIILPKNSIIDDYCSTRLVITNG
jgi:hypothetical protein